MSLAAFAWHCGIHKTANILALLLPISYNMSIIQLVKSVYQLALVGDSATLGQYETGETWKHGCLDRFCSYLDVTSLNPYSWAEIRAWYRANLQIIR